MDPRILKRWKREHRKKEVSDGDWKFHTAEWGGLEVMVMPRSLPGIGKVVDSNTGIVLKAPNHEAMRGNVVVNNGRMVNADDRALNSIVSVDSGKPDAPWYTLVHAWTIPTYIVNADDINDAWVTALDDLAKVMPRDKAIAQLDMTLGWCTDSVQCTICKLTIPGHFPPHVHQQARQFGWGLNATGGPVCPAHTIMKPYPTDEELAEMEKEIINEYIS